MKKIPVTESKQTNKPDLAKERSTSSPDKPSASSEVDQVEAEDPMAGLQADLDRFRDLALRSQADFENYKKRAAREKEEAIKYANKSLLQRLVAILDNFELGLAAAREQGEQSPIYAGMVLVQKQLNDYSRKMGCNPSKPKAHHSIQTCTRRSRMRLAIKFPKGPCCARPVAVIGLKTDCFALRTLWFPAVQQTSEAAYWLRLSVA